MEKAGGPAHARLSECRVFAFTTQWTGPKGFPRTFCKQRKGMGKLYLAAVAAAPRESSALLAFMLAILRKAAAERTVAGRLAVPRLMLAGRLISPGQQAQLHVLEGQPDNGWTTG